MRSAMIVLMLSFSSLLAAQGPYYGILIGQNVHTATSLRLTENGIESPFASRPSVNLGLVVSYPLTERIDIHTSVMYSSKVVTNRWSGPADGPVDATLYFHSISIAPKLQVNPFYGLYVNAGPSIDIKADTRLAQRGAYVSDSDEVPRTEAVRFGAVCSAGYAVELFDGFHIAPELSYDLGLSDTNSRLGGRYSSTRVNLQFFMR